MCIERGYLGRKLSTILLLAVAAVLAGAAPALAQSLPTEKDLVGIWDIKDKSSNTKIATIELMRNGQFEMVVGTGNRTTYPATPKAKWQLDGADFRVVYDPNGRGKQVYMRGKIDHWTKNEQGAFFELPLREVNRLPVKEGDVLILDK